MARPPAGGANVGGWPITQERWRSPFTCKAEMREMWTYSDGALYGQECSGGRVGLPGQGAGSWSTRRPGTSMARFRRENSPAGSGFRWTCSPMPEQRASRLPGDGDCSTVPRAGGSGPGSQPRSCWLQRSPAGGAAPVLMVPRRHRDGWSSATLNRTGVQARQAAMTLVAGWYPQPGRRARGVLRHRQRT